jgi:uncharacterized protein (TIGR03435 family)
MDFSGFQAQPGGRFRVAGLNLKTLITYAYRLHADQIIGGSDWTSSDLWEITAKAAAGTVPAVPKSFDPAVPDMMAQMVQVLIEERFHLKLTGKTENFQPMSFCLATAGRKSNGQTIRPHQFRHNQQMNRQRQRDGKEQDHQRLHEAPSVCFTLHSVPPG